MPKFLDGYKTTLGSRFLTDKITDTISESVIKDNLLSSSLDVKKIGDVYPIFITGLYDSEEKIPLFSHPYLFETKDYKKLLCTDVRLYIKKKIYDGSLSSLLKAFNNKTEYQFTRTRSILNLEWIEGDTDTLRTNLSFSTNMFGRWIADVLSKAFALDARDQLIITIVCSYYYQALFIDQTDHFDDETIQKWIIHTIKITQTNKEIVGNIFKDLSEVKGIESLVQGIKTCVDNVRLKDLSVLVLLTLVKNSWYGTNSKEIITVALEHPPTWMAVIYASMSERTYRSSLIYKLSERLGKRGLGDEYIKNVNNILVKYSLTNTAVALANAGLI